MEEMQSQMQEQIQLQQQINQVEQIVKQKLTKDALIRFGNIKSEHKEKYIQLLAVLAQSNVNVIDDNMLRDVLQKLTPKKHEFRIKRK